MIIGIFAVDESNGMGYRGKLPWPANSEDLKHFKSTTNGSVVVMGRKTWESSDMPTPLPNRTNVVFSRTKIPNVQTISTIAELLNLEQEHKCDIFVIGGSTLLENVRDALDKLIISRIRGVYECDNYIDLSMMLTDFRLTNSELRTGFTIETYERTT